MPGLGNKVTVPGDGASLDGYFALPPASGGGELPGVVVIHEIFGLTDHIRDVTDRLAEQGYAALAVDLFAGRNRALCMMRFMTGLLIDSLNHQGIRDLRSALSWLADRGEVSASRLGAVGFCLGGSFAIAWGSKDARLKAIAPFYAQNPRPLAAVERACPVVGSYPGNDFTAAAARRLEPRLEAAGVPHDIVIYPGAKHSFFNERNPGRHDPAASQDAWRRTLAFFETHVRNAREDDGAA